MRIEKFLLEYPEFQIFTVGNKVFNTANLSLKKFGINMLEGLFLTSLFFEKSKSARPTQLTKSFDLSKSNTSHIVRSLEKKKLIKRSTCEEDTRGYILGLTQKGEELCPKLITYFDKRQQLIESKFNKKDLDLLIETLTTFKLNNLQEK